MKKTVSIKENYEFRRLYHKGRSAATPFLVVYARKTRRAGNRIGLTVGVKLGCAVARNRMKRLMREAYRLHEHEFEDGLDLVLVARSRLAGARCAQAERALRNAMDRLGLVRKKENGALKVGDETK